MEEKIKKLKMRKFVLRKLNVSVKCMAEEPSWVNSFPKFLPLKIKSTIIKFIKYFEGRVVFDKKIYIHSVLDLFLYFHYQLLVGLTVFCGRVAMLVRNIFRINIIFMISKRKLGIKEVVKKYYLFPYFVNCVFYYDTIPIPFMPFQIDKKLVATSFRDEIFSRKVINYGFLGYRVLAWTSNYFLGYPKRIYINQKYDFKKKYRELLIGTCASVPGYNSGLEDKGYFQSALNRYYSEEEFKENKNAINFSENDLSEITKAVLIEKCGYSYKFNIVNANESLNYLGKKSTISIIFPIALVTKDNLTNKDWEDVPQKNVSGFILGYKDGNPTSVALSSISFIRMKPNAIYPFVKKICKDASIEFVAYIHTDDGGAVGDVYKTNSGYEKYVPIWGHCFSSMVGFVENSNVSEVIRKLKKWNG